MGRGRDTSILSIGEKKMSDSDYGRSIRSDARIDDLDLELVESFLGDSGASGGGIESLLRLGLIRGQAPDWRITNAALLLFGGAGGRRWHSGAGIRVMRVAGTARVFGQRRNVSSIGHANPPLARAVEKSLQLCMDRCGRSEALRDLLLKDMPEYPAFALREAVVNAVAHRNYERAKSETEVVFYDDRVEVTSPGLLVEGVTVADLSSDEPVHASRNPLLVRALAAAGYMRGDGTGLARLAGAMKESLLKAPRFSARMGSFAIALHNEPVVATAGPGWRHVVGRLGIESDQKRVLLSRPDGFTQQDYRQLNGVTPEVASRGIRDLVDRDIATPQLIGDDPVPVYYLTEELDSTRWFLEDRVPGLLRHFRAHSRLRSTDYREIFEVNYAVARRELGHLVELGFLRGGGRGRAAHYLPTPGLRK